MEKGVVIDANIINRFQEDYVKEGKIFITVDTILHNVGLAICDIIEHEWRKHFSHQYMEEWLTDEIKKGRIRYVKPNMNPDAIKKIRTRFGLNNSRDLTYIKCANSTSTKYILTEDIDFYDPKKKRTNPTERKKVMNQRKGVLCKYLKHVHKITVGMLQHCCDDLGLRC